MKCANPLTLKDGHGMFHSVSCGRCWQCRVNRTEEWTTRILHEARLKDENCFITLTYSSDFIPPHSSLSKRDLQLFFKRLRKTIDVRYFACGEYGEQYCRPHYHAILFGISKYARELVKRAWSLKKWGEIYPMGRIEVSELTEARARYCAKYLQKQLYGFGGEWYGKREKEFALVSRRPGIGFDFSQRYLDVWYEHDYIVVNGRKKCIPKYYISKLTEEQRKERSRRNRIHEYAALLKGKEEWNQEFDGRKQQELNGQAMLNLKKIKKGL